MTTDDQHDRFDPMTGQPIDRPTDATHRVAPTDIAAPGQVHADYDRQRTTPEPRDIILDLPEARALSPGRRAEARRRAADASLITIELPKGVDEEGKPNLHGTYRARPIAPDRILADVSLTGILLPSAQRSFYTAAKRLEAMGEDDLIKLGENVDEVLEKLNIGGSQDLIEAITKAYPIACLVDPRCVPLRSDITNPDEEICFDDLSKNDVATIIAACAGERLARTVAVAPFPDAKATA